MDVLVQISFKDDTEIQTGLDIENSKMRLPHKFIESLNPDQISYLAKLQLELENA